MILGSASSEFYILFPLLIFSQNWDSWGVFDLALATAMTHYQSLTLSVVSSWRQEEHTQNALICEKGSLCHWYQCIALQVGIGTDRKLCIYNRQTYRYIHTVRARTRARTHTVKSTFIDDTLIHKNALVGILNISNLDKINIYIKYKLF